MLSIINRKPLYIFDLDGTIALIEHRRHILDDLDNKERWGEFYEKCVDDVPNEPIIKIMSSLRLFSDILIYSGRSDIVRKETLQWLAANTFFTATHADSVLKMRTHGDYTPDELLKMSWYEMLSNEDKGRLVAVFDDRQKVVEMWRYLGITCLQVALGNF